ncbi:MAG TPA: N-6 DNA methylase, partial [Enhygromyxa sp.]|nr:N-6 DNA methylase [Enhygromyxa sp.]
MSVSEQLYATYSELRARLGGELQDLSIAQTILDRVLVVALAERRGLLPRNTLASAVERPGLLWRNFLAVFQAIERGALFRDLDAIERLDVSDATCVELVKLCGHDCDDVSVLGQLFERSIADLERTSKRKVEGIFYTPASVTELLIRETVGRTIADARARAGGDPEALQAALARVRVLDPACGGGALLLAAFDALAQERGLDSAIASENLFGVDKDGEAVEIAKLSLWLRTAELGTRLADLDRNIRQGNSVVDDPRVDASAFDWQRWPAGFDVVIGNPPYVRHELLGAYKDHWSRTFEVYDGSADLFVYFFERGLRLLAPGGRLGFVVSNKWLRGGYATRLRELLAREYTIESLVDFGHAPLFPDADAFPCIITVRRNAPAVDHEVSVTQHQVEPHEFSLLQRTLDEQGWSLEPPTAQALLEKLRRNGVALEDYAAIKPYRGVVTGCNAAFLIDQSTRDRLCREHARSSEILKKYVRGQDVGRWSAQWRERWMIFTRRGIDIDAYPAIEAHLSRYRSQLEPRPQDFDGGEWPGRKPGNYAWYEIQDSTDYHEHFERPKILYQEIQFHPAYALDDV